jgi:hypothetical protein
MEQAFEATEIQKIIKAFTELRRVCPDIVMFVFWIQQEWKHQAGVDIGRSDSISADESMVDIDADAILVTAVADAVLYCPASILILLPQAIWVFVPAFRQPAGFDFFVQLKGIALLLLCRNLRLGNRNESRISDLTTTDLETLGAQVCIKHLKEFLDYSRLAQSLS